MIHFKKPAILTLIACFAFLYISCNRKKGSGNEGAASNASGVLVQETALKKITGDHQFDTANGPLYMDGSIYFVNENFDHPENSRTLRMNADGTVDTLLSDNGVMSTLRASGKGTIYACEMLGHKVVELNKNGKIIGTIADRYNGRRIDGPNDLVVDSRGGVYFTDSQITGRDKKMQETPAVYYVDTMGKVTRVIDDLAFPNGLGISPDDSTLYVTDSNSKYVMAYDINGDGTLSNARNFCEPERPAKSDVSGADGMTVDSEGNVYVATTQGLGVQVFNEDGKHIANISCPAPPNNVTFGGTENKTLFISAKDGIYAIETAYPGL